MLLLVVGLLFLASCSGNEIQETQATTIEAPDPLPPAEPIEQAPAVEEEQAENISEEIEINETKSAYEWGLEFILEKAKSIEGYRYLMIIKEIDEEGNLQAMDSELIYTRKNKTRIILSQPIELKRNTWYDEIFLDRTERAAYALCSGNEKRCGDLSRGFYLRPYSRVPYRPDPMKILEEVPFTAEIISHEELGERPVAVVTYERGNQTEILYLDKGYGMMHKQQIYENNTLVKEYVFTDIFLNSVSEWDVTFPEGYTLYEANQ